MVVRELLWSVSVLLGGRRRRRLRGRLVWYAYGKEEGSGSGRRRIWVVREVKEEGVKLVVVEKGVDAGELLVRQLQAEVVDVVGVARVEEVVGVEEAVGVEVVVEERVVVLVRIPQLVVLQQSLELESLLWS